MASKCKKPALNSGLFVFSSANPHALEHISAASSNLVCPCYCLKATRYQAYWLYGPRGAFSRPPSVATILLPAMITVVIMAMMPPVRPVWPAATEQQRTGQHHNPCSLAFHVRTSDKRSQGLLTLDRTQSGCSGWRTPLVIFPARFHVAAGPITRMACPTIGVRIWH